MSFIIELVDFISRDGPDTPIYVIHYKSKKTLNTYQDFELTHCWSLADSLSNKPKNICKHTRAHLYRIFQKLQISFFIFFFLRHSSTLPWIHTLVSKSIQFYYTRLCHEIYPIAFSKFFNGLLSIISMPFYCRMCMHVAMESYSGSVVSHSPQSWSFQSGLSTTVPCDDGKR